MRDLGDEESGMREMRELKPVADPSPSFVACPHRLTPYPSSLIPHLLSFIPYPWTLRCLRIEIISGSGS